MQRQSGEGPLTVIAALAAKKNIPIIETDVRKLDSLAGGGAHQGVAAVASETDYLTVE